MIQAAAGEPLTVYGKGGQTRGFLDIRDTLACVELAIPPQRRPASSACSTSSPNPSLSSDLAQKVSDAAGGARIVHLDDPRVELEEHYYRAAHTKLLDLGLMPFLLGDELLADLLSIARTHIDRMDRAALEPKVLWRSTASSLPGDHNPRPRERPRNVSEPSRVSRGDRLALPGCTATTRRGAYAPLPFCPGPRP